MLKVENIKKTYGLVKALDGLSFELKEGEIFGLLGENGAGKTTTFRIIMGLIEADCGKVTMNNQKIDYNMTDNIGFLTEERSLLGKLTVKEQVIFYGTLKNLKEKDILTKLDYYLDYFNISDYKNRKIKELSKGNQQKIQFITAIINEPKLLILDEPFTGLDPINVQLFKEIIYKLKEKGCMIIFSSHQMEHVEEFCEKLIILVKGKSILEGYVKDIKESYRKKTIEIIGDVNVDDLKNIKGVNEVINLPTVTKVNIADKSIIPLVFKAIKEKNITKFNVLEPSLNDIFIEKVGQLHEK